MFKFVRSVVSAGGTGGMVSTFGMARPSKNDEASVGNEVMFVARVCNHVGIDSISATSWLMAPETLGLAVAAAG